MNFLFVFIFDCFTCCDSRCPRPAAGKVIPPGIKFRFAQSGPISRHHVSDNEPQAQFERVVMPHLDAAYNLARWLAGDEHDAQDITQEACVRAFRFVSGCRGSDGRAWLLAIVRNTAFSWIKKNRPAAVVSIDDDELAEIADQNPTAGSFHSADAGVLRAALEALPLAVSRSARAARAGRAFVQGNRRSRRGAGRHGHVAARPCATAIARRAQSEGESMNCAESRLLLHAHIDGELDVTSSLELERHLKTCAACATGQESVQ